VLLLGAMRPPMRALRLSPNAIFSFARPFDAHFSRSLGRHNDCRHRIGQVGQTAMSKTRSIARTPS